MTTFTKISKDADGFSSNTYRVQLAKRQARKPLREIVEGKIKVVADDDYDCTAAA